MKLTQASIIIASRSSESVDVDGYISPDLPGLGIHRTYKGQGWTITHLRTGLRLPGPLSHVDAKGFVRCPLHYRTRRDALDYAQRFVDACDARGTSPDYDDPMPDGVREAGKEVWQPGYVSSTGKPSPLGIPPRGTP